MKSNKTFFSRSSLRQLPHKTPYFLFNGEVVEDNLAAYKRALPAGSEVCFAMKANSEEAVLKLLNRLGCSFEVASVYELSLLRKIGVKSEKILYGTAVKPEDSIADFFNYGVRRYAFDSEEELLKISRQAPGAQVYLRILVDDKAHSVFTMSEKFGIAANQAASLFAKAPGLGLEPYGLSFNVGSQALNAEAWANGLKSVKLVMSELSAANINIKTVNLGGGFPFKYFEDDKTPSIANIGGSIRQAARDLPYRVQFLAEPGRGLVANAFVLVAGVFARSHRPTGDWLYLDAGAYNAVLETMSYQGPIHYEVELLRDSDVSLQPYVLTGPTGDSLDVIGKDVRLPADIKAGDRLVVRDTGAYSFTLTTRFNGFPVPSLYER